MKQNDVNYYKKSLRQIALYCSLSGVSLFIIGVCKSKGWGVDFFNTLDIAFGSNFWSIAIVVFSIWIWKKAI